MLTGKGPAEMTTRAIVALLVSTFLLGGCATNEKPLVVVPQPPVVEPPNPIQEELRLKGNEQYPGQNALTAKVGRDNLEGTMVIQDTPDTWHAGVVKETAVYAGVPESHIVVKSFLIDLEGGILNVPEDTRVVVIPLWHPFYETEGVALATQNSTIGVASAGNVDGDTNWERDLYHPNHPEGSNLAEVYKHLMSALRVADGRAILATWAIINTDGTEEAVRGAVPCGDAMHWCFAVRAPAALPDVEGDVYGFLQEVGATSHAAPILGAHAFYLSQLWNTADEVFAVLKECAIDIGEPGPDREYGLGVPSAICPTVQDRERQAAGSSLSVAGGSAAISALLAGGGTSVSFGRQPNLTLFLAPRAPDLFVSFSSLAAGKTFGSGTTAYTALVGMGRSPLVSSALVRQGWSAFAETGLKRVFVSWGDTSVSFLAAAGAQGGPVRSFTGRTGFAIHRPSFTVYGGAAFAEATVPIPGHEAVGVPPAGVSRMGWEVSLHRSFSFGAR